MAQSLLQGGVRSMPQHKGSGGVAWTTLVNAAQHDALHANAFCLQIKLESFTADGKIKVIKEIRALTNLGLKEAKELVGGVGWSMSVVCCVGLCMQHVSCSCASSKKLLCGFYPSPIMPGPAKWQHLQLWPSIPGHVREGLG